MEKIGLPMPVLRTPTVDPGEEFTAHSEDALLDTFDRRARDLRISLTDFCNLRCTYCMPEEGVEFMSRDSAMSGDEIVRFVRIAVEKFGVDQVRFTGGEPLTRKDINDIIAGCRGVGAATEHRTDDERDRSGQESRGAQGRRIGSHQRLSRHGRSADLRNHDPAPIPQTKCSKASTARRPPASPP
jgi:hypothetical protein